MRMALIIALALGATACLTGRDYGLATYDALAQAQRECAAKGGVFKQKPESNAARIDSFACERN